MLSLAVLIAGVVIYSLGLAPTFTLTNDLIVGTAAPEHAGVVSAMSETGSELGGALGIALLGSLGTAFDRLRPTHPPYDGESWRRQESRGQPERARRATTPETDSRVA